MRTSVSVKNVRRVLCVFPAYAPSFGTFSHAYKLMPGVRAFMPPQGLLLIAAYMPAEWPVRFIDENICPASATDFAWADVVLVSGMHIQAPQIRDIHARAKAAGKVVVLGGPSASASPEFYPDIEYLHLGELGDATDHMIETIDRSVAPPAAQSSRRRFGLEQRRNGRGGEVFGHFEVVSRPQAAFRRGLQPGAARASSSPNSGSPVARDAGLGNR